MLICSAQRWEAAKSLSTQLAQALEQCEAADRNERMEADATIAALQHELEQTQCSQEQATSHAKQEVDLLTSRLDNLRTREYQPKRAAGGFAAAAGTTWQLQLRSC